MEGGRSAVSRSGKMLSVMMTYSIRWKVKRQEKEQSVNVCVQVIGDRDRLRFQDSWVCQDENKCQTGTGKKVEGHE